MKSPIWKPLMTEMGLWTVWVWFCLGSFFWTLMHVLTYFGVQTEAAGWAQAIGTVAAVFAAIWTVRQQESRELKAKLEAAIVQAKALATMADDAAHWVSRLSNLSSPGLVADFELSMVEARFNAFSAIDVLKLPESLMVDQVILVRSNLEYALQCGSQAKAARNNLPKSAHHLGFLPAVHLVVKGAWLNLKILQGRLEYQLHTGALRR